MTGLMRWFSFSHLPEPLNAISKQCCDLATLIDQTLPNSEEKTAGLRKLLEAKDCFVRAKLLAQER